jgi:Zn-dependent peptidase ImmA (M78 family)/transcriptional regulator with XRE-family HTH domain
MSPNPNMLRLARQLKGFQQTEAAKKLEIDQSLLSRMENGVSEIRDDVLMRAGSLYDVRRSFFFQADPIYGAPVSVHPMWRRKADVTARDLDSIVAEMNVRVMHLRRFLEAADVAKVNDLPRLDVEDYEGPAEIAALVRSHWQVPRGPIQDLTVLVERAGVLVVHSAMSDAAVSGVTFSAPGMPPLIVLNSSQPADRMRFTLAHELAHLVMHKFPTADMENEANAFASAFLMPSADIGPLLRSRKIDISLLAALKPEWKVSMQSVIMRAKSLGLLNRNQEEYLWKQMSARKWRLREPPELDFAHERPSVVFNLVKIFRDQLGYSHEETSKLLHIFESRLHNLYPIDNDTRDRPKFTVIG